MYRVSQKSKPPTDLSINRFIHKKSTDILHVHELRNDSTLYQVLCAAAIVLNILWFLVTNTQMRRSSIKAISIHTIIDVTLYVMHRIFNRQNI